MNKILLVGDVHGKYARYLELIKDAEYSIQLGDFGFDYSCLDNIDYNKHKVLFGNHDNYDHFYTLPHSLGDFGEYELNGLKFFFVRGSLSIDWKPRYIHEQAGGQKTWFKEEELTALQSNICIKLYERTKPDIVITHDCPIVAKTGLGGSGYILQFYGYSPDHCCNTQQLLQSLWDIHQPRSWFFAHWHRSKTFKVGNTTFTCLNELETMECK